MARFSKVFHDVSHTYNLFDFVSDIFISESTNRKPNIIAVHLHLFIPCEHKMLSCVPFWLFKCFFKEHFKL